MEVVEVGKKRHGELVIEKKVKRPKGCKFDRFVRTSQSHADIDSLKTRSLPKKLVELLHLLNDAQKMAIKQIGFGHMLEFQVKNIPSNLAYFLVDKFHHLSLYLIL